MNPVKSGNRAISVQTKGQPSAIVATATQALQEKLEQARRLLRQVSDPSTTQGLKDFIANLKERSRNLLEPE
jgi:hypothetical protein